MSEADEKIAVYRCPCGAQATLDHLPPGWLSKRVMTPGGIDQYGKFKGSTFADVFVCGAACYTKFLRL